MTVTCTWFGTCENYASKHEPEQMRENNPETYCDMMRDKQTDRHVTEEDRGLKYIDG